MRVLLVNPDASQPVFSTGPTYLPLGLAYVASSLRQAGHEIRVLDLTVKDLSDEEFLEAVRSWGPAWIGFTATTPTVKRAFQLCRLAKAKLGVVTVIGGPHVSASPEEALEQGVDLVVRGEGEQTSIELCEHLQDPWQVPGVSCLRQGKICHAPERTLASDLDRLPFPARDLFPDLKNYTGQPVLGNRTPVGTLATSRGCPYNCNFCYKAITQRAFRARSVDNVLEEWRILVKEFHVAEIAICDDAFTVVPERVISLCEKLVAEKLTIPWSCPNGIRAHPITLEMLKAMRRAGCYRTALGVESGDGEVLSRIDKGLHLDHIRNAFRLCRQVGIKTTAFLMLGNPGETRESMEKTIQFAVELNPDYAQFLIATPYPGTRLREEVLRDGTLKVEDWDEYGSYESRVYFEMPGLPASLVLEMQKKAYRTFYLRPSYILRQLTTPHTYRFLGKSFKGLWGFVLTSRK